MIDYANLFVKYQVHASDTGSPAVQIIVWTRSINAITVHMQNNTKDFSSKRGLLSLVSSRKSMLRYLKSKKPTVYQELIQDLSIRR
jgi:small subunit ribosomal protein S15